MARGVGPHLLPDPGLDWLRRATGALGVWIGELDADDGTPRAERMIDAERLSVAEVAAIDRKIERARDTEQGGVERLECGTLVCRAANGVAVGLLLPEGYGGTALAEAERDLDRLLDGTLRRPHVVALAQAQATSLESVGSVGLRLAYQLERSLDAEVIVAAAEQGGVRVVGVSERADRRLLDVVVPRHAPLALVARGRPATLTTEDPLGGAVVDRRQPMGTLFIAPIQVGSDPVGAVAIQLPGGVEPVGPARAELFEALAAAAPRLRLAIEAEQHRRVATTDALTSLRNRRGLDEALHRHGVQAGALVVADLDHFKRLNDTLGHPAGDAALMHFGRIIREQVRAGDVPARLGGDELAIWLPGASLELGGRIAERIRSKLETTPWDWQGRPWPLSASFGVTAYQGTALDVEKLLAQADAALYAAKKGGRNRVEIKTGEVAGAEEAGPLGSGAAGP